MLFLRDNGGRVHHRSASSQRLERATRSSYRFATFVTGCLSSPPFCPLGRLTTSKEAACEMLDAKRRRNLQPTYSASLDGSGGRAANSNKAIDRSGERVKPKHSVGHPLTLGNVRALDALCLRMC